MTRVMTNRLMKGIARLGVLLCLAIGLAASPVMADRLKDADIDRRCALEPARRIRRCCRPGRNR